MNQLYTYLIAFTIAAYTTACGPSNEPAPESDSENNTAAAGAESGEDHTHDEVALGTFDIQGVSVEAAQGHGVVEAGKEGHLVIKLPYNDSGSTVVRAWIGVEDRTLSAVGKGEYAPSHDDYDIHAVAPDPLPEGAQWWIEIEKPDGTKATGSFDFLTE